MPEPVVHITLDANRTLCQRSVGALAGDTYTTDIIRATSYRVKGCPDCLAALDQPRTYAEMLTSNRPGLPAGIHRGAAESLLRPSDLGPQDPRRADGLPLRTL